MKHRNYRKPTRAQKELISKRGLDHANWLIHREDMEHLYIVNRTSGRIRKLQKVLALLLLTGMAAMISPCQAAATEASELLQVESTAYCHGEVTASGHEVRPGIAAGKPEWIGLTCLVYEDDEGGPGKLLGIYEILDTGGDRRIVGGTCIDVYIPDYDACREYGRRNVWIQLIKAEG